jgi:hypothetical protein
MPYSVEWAEPELVVTVGQVSVYKTYRNDEIHQGENEYHFVIDPLENEGDGVTRFDIRDLVAWRERSGESYDDKVAVLVRAIENGELTIAEAD